MLSFCEMAQYSYYGKIHQYPRSRAITQFRRFDHDQNPRTDSTYPSPARKGTPWNRGLPVSQCRIAISENTSLTMIYSRLKYQCQWCVSVKTFISAMRSCRLSRIPREDLSSFSRNAFSPSPRANARFRGGSACGTRINIFILQRCVYLRASVPITGRCMLRRARNAPCTCIPRQLAPMWLSLSLSLSPSLNYFTARKAQSKEYIGANEKAASMKDNKDYDLRRNCNALLEHTKTRPGNERA